MFGGILGHEPGEAIGLDHVEGRAVGKPWSLHLYVDDASEFRYDFRSSWEPMALSEAMADPSFLGWLRIEDRKDWALTIPYQMGSETKPFYPDFLVFRKVGKRVVADILDPHDPGRDDWLPKVRGLAAYASKHRSSFGKIEACFVEKKKIRRLNLALEANWKAALQAEGTNNLRSLFVPS